LVLPNSHEELSVHLSEAYRNRFGGIARLYGEDALQQLASAHFVLVGVGGVGTWAAEALARSGVGKLTLIDLDDICVTNINRQLHALTSTVGESKIATLGRRLSDINPELELVLVEDFLSKDTISSLIKPEHNVVLDATDSAHLKSALVAYCSAIKKPLLLSGSAGGKSDPRQILCADLGKTISDPMLAKVRQQLYRFYNFAKDKKRKFNVEVVYSTEQMQYPQADGSVCQSKSKMEAGVKLDCAGGFGASTMITGSFGFMLASRAIEKYLTKCSKNAL